MPDGFQLEVNVQVRPVQMLSVQQLHLQYRCDLRVLEPGKNLEGQKVFLTANMEP